MPQETECFEKYVAFCDILGFSNKVMNDFDKTLELYKELANSLQGTAFRDGVKVTMYSDSMVITADKLGDVVTTVQMLWFTALAHDFMIRGGIAKGRYWERRDGDHLFVASDALVEAVKLENTVGFPAVMIADDIEIPEGFWLTRFAESIFSAPILHFRDRNIVNPFNHYWFNSAAQRTRQMLEDSPAHKAKYLWFLALYDAVGNDQPLIPGHVFDSFLERKILVRKPASEPPIIDHQPLQRN